MRIVINEKCYNQMTLAKLKWLVSLCVQVSIGQERLSAGLDPAEDYSLVEMHDTDQSVVMATRRIRQLGLLGNEIAEHARHHHLDLKRLDVLCTNQGMQVQMEFLEPFDGIVYSKGQFDNPKCRYVKVPFQCNQKHLMN